MEICGNIYVHTQSSAHSQYQAPPQSAPPVLSSTASEQPSLSPKVTKPGEFGQLGDDDDDDDGDDDDDDSDDDVIIPSSSSSSSPS